MGAATILPVGVEDDHEAPAPGPRPGQRELAARRADAARRRRAASRAAGPAPSLFAGTGSLRLVPRFELAGEALVANDDLATLRRPRSAAPGRTARPAGPAALRAIGAGAPDYRPTAATYRRRRSLVGALILGVLLAGGWALGALGGGPLTASEAGSRGAPVAGVSLVDAQPVSRSTYVVQPGDTLWSIARQLVQQTPGTDVRPVVDALAAERHGRALEVGETIVLP